jgi:hypothetical protein
VVACTLKLPSDTFFPLAINAKARKYHPMSKQCY